MEARDILVKFFATITKASKIFLKNEMHTVEKKYMSISDYTMKIKNICESLASIGVTVEIEDKVEVCLYGLTPEYKQLRTLIQTRESIPTFNDLASLLIVEEKNSLENILLY